MLILDPYDKKFFENPKALGSFFFPSIRKLVWAGAWQVFSLMPNKEFFNFTFQWCFKISNCFHTSQVSQLPGVNKRHHCFMHGWTAAWWNVELSWRKSSPSSTKAGFPAALKYSFMVETPTEFCLKSFQQLNLIQFYSELPVTAWQHAHIHKINYPFSVEYFKQYYS